MSAQVPPPLELPLTVEDGSVEALGDVYEKDAVCPKCGAVGTIVRGYGMAGGGMGTYEGCDADGCDYFKKEQDPECVPTNAKKKRWFFDTEFAEDGRTIELISIAFVCEDGREYFAVSKEFDPAKCNAWVRANVLPKLPPLEFGWKTRKEIAEDIRALLLSDGEPEIWAYFADYDWVVLCQLYGTMEDLPKGFPYWCRDLKQLMADRGVKREDLPPDGADEHSALADARWVRNAYNTVMSPPRTESAAEFDERIKREALEIFPDAPEQAPSSNPAVLTDAQLLHLCATLLEIHAPMIFVVPREGEKFIAEIRKRAAATDPPEMVFYEPGKAS